MYLETITSPQDVKKLDIEQLNILSGEVRETLIKKLSEYGGHIGPNLGVVELTVALHYVFDSPSDKIVFDVSHQCYAHKMLTGRKEAFMDSAHYSDVTGYTNPLESEHDFFTVGHTSTSVSLALGLARARDLNGGRENVIAVIGDGSLSGGEALEAIDYAGEYDRNLIIIVNDNDQSIAENHGGLYKTLRELRENDGKCKHNIFEGFGLEYRYLEEGHDVGKLVSLFESVKDIDHPVVLHIHTVKGKGLAFAETDRERWHAGGPFDVKTGNYRAGGSGNSPVFDSLKELLDTNDKAVVVNAGTPMGLGFTEDVRDEYASRGQFVDVGIAEENAVAMISGMAKGGATAVFGTFAPFLQRTYDQVSHDLCLNNNPATILVINPGATGMTSNTHIAMCDIQFFSHIPNLVYLAPACDTEYRQMFRYATTQKEHPVAIRVPRALEKSMYEDDTDYSVMNKSKVVMSGNGIAIIGVGCMLGMAKDTAGKYKEETGRDITVINPRFLTGLDEELLESLKENHHLIITLEDGEVDGGFGQRVAGFFGESDMKVKNFGISKKFHTDYKPVELLAEHGMTVEKLVGYIKINESRNND